MLRLSDTILHGLPDRVANLQLMLIICSLRRLRIRFLTPTANALHCLRLGKRIMKHVERALLREHIALLISSQP
jgi:hypothetical protein